MIVLVLVFNIIFIVTTLLLILQGYLNQVFCFIFRHKLIVLIGRKRNMFALQSVCSSGL